jgi:hypothetical protein
LLLLNTCADHPVLIFNYYLRDRAVLLLWLLLPGTVLGAPMAELMLPVLHLLLLLLLLPGQGYLLQW